jgi:hypothetical protein
MSPSDAYRAGLRDGVKSILRGGRYGSPHTRIGRSVGSPHTDRAARYADANRFGEDIRRAEKRFDG